MNRQEHEWIEAYLNETISPEAFEQMQDRMAENEAFRASLRRYLAMDSHLAMQVGDAETAALSESWESHQTQPTSKRRFVPLAMAAALAFFLGLGWMSLFDSEVEPSESTAHGFAVIHRLANPVWPSGEPERLEGDMLSADTFHLAGGTALIQFFSGAEMTVTGPAEIELSSAWEAICHEGSVRMQVPPAARGFKLHAPATEIVDLGTEFGLEVRGDAAQVEVFDGEIAVRHRAGDERLIQRGAAWSLPSDQVEAPVAIGTGAYPDPAKLDAASDTHRLADFERWLAHRDQLSSDDRLIAYYTFDPMFGRVENRAPSLGENHDGSIILAQTVDGRWDGMKSALEFRRPGSRVRVNIPGEFSAFTFAAWVRIDSLDRKYNALFMGDGYETGEPHWQIREDGAMMLSVMVDDQKPNPGAPNDAGLHRVYFSPPMWDLSMSGQWMQLVSVFDPAARQVSHFVNGDCISEAPIIDKFQVETLRIGNAEIGNWGLPFREEPWFAIRNLNGRMDELAIFDVALSAEEIRAIYKNSRVGR